MRFLILFFFSLSLSLLGRNIVTEQVYDDSVKTVSIYRVGWETGNPIITLGSSQKIAVNFDRLGADYMSYQYTIYHCNRYWERSNLMQSDYVATMGLIDIFDVESSVNTTIDYNHYSFSFPNEDLRIKISGNYILRVTKNYEETNVVFEKRFMVIENDVSIAMEAKQASIVEYMDEYQEVDFNLDISEVAIRNPYEDLYVVLLQNGRWDNAIRDLKPLYVKTDELIYELENENLFPGSSEFRQINFKSFNYQTQFIKQYMYEKGRWHVFVMDDDVRRFKVYEQKDDINGKYLISIDDQENAHTEADYAYVHFSLPYDVIEIDGDIYVYGALSNWQVSAVNKMEFNSDAMQYELTMLLKQGYYDYKYVYVERGSNKIDNTYVEGSHYETENDYQIILYTFDVYMGYDRIIGYKRVNSINK